jgi:hypothetical protein
VRKRKKIELKQGENKKVSSKIQEFTGPEPLCAFRWEPAVAWWGMTTYSSGSGSGASRSSYTLLGLEAEAEPIAPGLHVVATPIGNLRDISLRALSTLSAADLILAEDTRVTKVLLAHYGITTPLMAYHEHNAARMRPELLHRIAEGAAVVLVSDAGTPLISDPGYRLVAELVEAGLAVTAVPGASAVLTALAVGARRRHRATAFARPGAVAVGVSPARR